MAAAREGPGGGGAAAAAATAVVARVPLSVVHLREALRLAKTGVHFDNAGDLEQATHYYDKTLQVLERVLRDIPQRIVGGPARRALEERRIEYANRLDLLRPHVQPQSGSVGVMDSVGSGGDLANRSRSSGTASGGGHPHGHTQHHHHSKQQRRMSRMPFEVMVHRAPQIIATGEGGEGAGSVTGLSSSGEVSPSPIVDIGNVVEAPPAEPFRRPYWHLRVVGRTIDHGGYLTPSLFVTRMVWRQPGAKFNALSAKIQAFEQIAYFVRDRIEGVEKPNNDSAIENCVSVFMDFYTQLVAIQNQLAKPLQFIHEVQVSDELIGGGGDVLGSPTPSTTKSNLKKFNTMVSTLGKNVVKYSEVAYQRVGATFAGRATDDELARYTELVEQVCRDCQVFEDWIVWIRGQIKDLGELCSSPAAKSRPSRALRGMTTLMEVHERIAQFMQEVVVEIIFRDVEQLISRYMRKMRKSFAKMYWDEDQPLEAMNPSTWNARRTSGSTTSFTAIQFSDNLGPAGSPISASGPDAGHSARTDFRSSHGSTPEGNDGNEAADEAPMPPPPTEEPLPADMVPFQPVATEDDIAAASVVNPEDGAPAPPDQTPPPPAPPEAVPSTEENTSAAPSSAPQPASDHDEKADG